MRYSRRGGGPGLIAREAHGRAGAGPNLFNILSRRRDGQIMIPFRMHGPLSDPTAEPEHVGLGVPGLESAGDRRRGRSSDKERDATEDEPRVRRLERMLKP